MNELEDGEQGLTKAADVADSNQLNGDIFNIMEPVLSKQEQKYHLSLSGEFSVAAQLQRQCVSAAVTYGNAKNADVVAFSNSDRAVVIEVKSTSQDRWVVGSKLPLPSLKPWVFVYMPIDPKLPPKYYVFLQSELHDVLDPGEKAYYRKFKEKNGVEYGNRPGVVNLTRKQAEPFENKWEKIIDQLSV